MVFARPWSIRALLVDWSSNAAFGWKLAARAGGQLFHFRGPIGRESPILVGRLNTPKSAVIWAVNHPADGLIGRHMATADQTCRGASEITAER